MNIFTDASYVCACGRDSLFEVCTRCLSKQGRKPVPTPKDEQITVPSAAPETIPDKPIITPAMRAEIEKGKTEFAQAGVFDLWGEPQTGPDLLYFAVAKGQDVPEPCMPIYRLRRQVGGIRESWIRTPLLPIVEGKHQREREESANV